jgi:hypothetical protein
MEKKDKNDNFKDKNMTIVITLMTRTFQNNSHTPTTYNQAANRANETQRTRRHCQGEEKGQAQKQPIFSVL